MASRRGFLACAICSAIGLVATGVEAPAQAQAGGMVRKDLERIFEYRRLQMMSLFPPAATQKAWDEV